MIKHMVLLLLVIVGCAGSPTCRTEIEEPVSQCRAHRACISSSSSGKALQFIANLLGGMGSGLAGDPQAPSQTEICIEREMSNQRANAGIEDTTQRCKIRRTSRNELAVECRGR